jgi:hypothetical protein
MQYESGLCFRCAALDYKISKSQKKVLKRLHRFLSQGDTKTGDDSKPAGGSCVPSDSHGENAREFGKEVVVYESREFVICSAVNCFVLNCKAVMSYVMMLFLYCLLVVSVNFHCTKYLEGIITQWSHVPKSFLIFCVQKCEIKCQRSLLKFSS